MQREPDISKLRTMFTLSQGASRPGHRRGLKSQGYVHPDLQKEKETSHEYSSPTISKHYFNFLYPIGKGGFGRVWKVELKKVKRLFAMKAMSKLRIVSKRSVHSVMNERKILSVLRHPLIVNMQFAFQDRENLYLVMDLMPGGDLRYHIGKVRRFSEEQTRFFVACIVSGLEYIHANGIIHRDIKPENLVLDSKGYVRITDFGIARVFNPENSQDTSGTPGYMAPEVMCRMNHGYVADYFALGVIVYEFMMGRRPYNGKNRKEIRDQILAKQVQIKRQEIPEGWSIEAADFANKMLMRKADHRLGAKGAKELKAHPWLQDFPWKELKDKTLEAPFRLTTEDNFDPRVGGEWKDEIDPTIEQDSIQSLFSGYFFDFRMSAAKPPESTLEYRKFSLSSKISCI
ncbi:unnamed protein product [Blepharisma stoltei]|uniref:non-specific serine/threonine protein kinase n=1 Tax=Blepharisma stoltei TaxID=1481888 RepID=A0AAU9J3E3_9CILI|nr:unnamed protein product [Blepharisma stoltei]